MGIDNEMEPLAQHKNQGEGNGSMVVEEGALPCEERVAVDEGAFKIGDSKATNEVKEDENKGREKVKTGFEQTNPLSSHAVREEYVDGFNVENSNGIKGVSDEEIEKENKLRRRRAIVAAVSDGLNSLANLYFTTKGAPSMYKADNGIAAVEAERNKRVNEAFEKRDLAAEKLRGTLQAKQLGKNKPRERFYMNGGLSYSVDKENWQSKDFVDEFFNLVEAQDNEYKNIKDIINATRWTTDMKLKKGEYIKERKDLFKGRPGTYFKRDLLETLFHDGELEAADREKLGALLNFFEQQWIKLKHQ